MSITLLGPISRYPSLAGLRDVLAGVPEAGEFRMGGPKLSATAQLRAFTAAGVPTIPYTTDWAVARRWLQAGATVLGRKEDHTQGRDIKIITHDAIRPRFRRDWWSKFLPSTEEWRIHVFDGRVIARGRKLFVGPNGYAGYTNIQGIAIRSRRNGWHMQHDVEPTDALRDAGKAAVAALPGYLYGAVDLLVTPTGPVVLEVNRLPAMDAYTTDAYARAIRRYVTGERGQRPPGTAGQRLTRRRSARSAAYEGVEID